MAEIVSIITDEMAMAHVEGRKPRLAAPVVKKIMEIVRE